MLRRLFFIFCFVLGLSQLAQAQVLLSLIFGEKLNSPNVEFGLEGGVNFSKTSGFISENSLGTFNLGFYFDFRLKNNWYFATGCVVKGTVGLDALKQEDLNVLRPELIAAYRPEGTYSQRLSYFQCPFTIKYRFIDQIDVEVGPQLGLLHKAFVQLDEKQGDTEIKSKTKNISAFRRIDAGVMFGTGFKLLKGKGLSFAVKYFHGLTDITKSSQVNAKNRTLYLLLGIPVGRGKVGKNEEQ